MNFPIAAAPADLLLAGVCWLSYQAAILIVLVVLAQWLTRRWLPVRWRYNLWLLVVLRLLLPFSPESPASIFNVIRPSAAVAAASAPRRDAAPASASARTPQTLAQTSPKTETAAMVSTTPDAVKPPAGNTAATNAPLAVTPPSLRPIIHTPGIAAARSPVRWLRVASWIWLAGIAVFAVCIVRATWRVLRQVRQATPVDDPAILALLDSCQTQMRVRSAIVLRETPLVKSPALFGVFRPRFLLPPGLIRDFSPAELRYVFLHELAHVRRHDVAVNWLVTLLQAVHWFNPFVWFGFARMRADRELACDALALSLSGDGEARTYGLTIVKLLETFTRGAASPGLVGILENGRQMQHRIRLIAAFRPSGKWSWLAAALMAALAVVGLTDAVRTSHAQTAAAPQAAGAAASPLRVTVLDAQTGQPIADAKVIPGFMNGVSYSGDLPVPLRTDAQGVALLPNAMSGWGLSVFRDDYAPRTVEFRQFAGEPLLVMPKEYTIRLVRGGVIGGTLRDASGQPLAGVKVEIKGSSDPRPPGGEKLPPIQEYPFYDTIFNPGATTDAQGRWTCAQFAADTEDLLLTFERPDHSIARFRTPLPSWKSAIGGGELIDMAAARRGDLVCVFPPGVDVRGVVVDDAGHPLKGIEVTETDRRHHRGPVSVSLTEADGRFLLPHRDPHQVLLRLNGPGLASRAQVVTISPGMPELSLAMHPVAPLRVRTVDAGGHPVDGVRINVFEPQLGWTGQTGADGRVAWDLAPREPVMYSLGVKDYGPRVLPFAADGTEHTVVLRKGDPPGVLLTINANDEAGHPVDRFKVVAVCQTEGGFMNNFDRPENLGEGRDGGCTILVPASVTQQQEFRVKIEAADLLPYISDPLEPDTADVALAATLRRVNNNHATLRLPDGRPAADATLVIKDAINGERSSMRFTFWGPGKPRVETEFAKVRSDAQGGVTLPNGADDSFVAVMHDAAYLYTTLGQLRQSPETRLLPYGRLEGVLTVNGHPRADQRIEIWRDRQTRPMEVSISYILSTDRDGRFVFDRVPAGHFSVYYTDFTGHGQTPQSFPVGVEFASGQTTKLDYRADGRTVVGKIEAAAADVDIDWKKNLGACLLSAPRPDVVYSYQGVAYEDFMSRADYHRANKQSFQAPSSSEGTGMRGSYQPTFATDGSFRVEGVPPGTYQLHVELVKDNSRNSDENSKPIGTLERTVIIPQADAEHGTAAVDLNTMKVAVDPTALPRRPALAFSARSLDGQPVNLADYRGKNVLLVFWASWAAIPPAQLAEWKALAEAHGDDERFVMLGVSLDDDPAAARQFAQASSLPGTLVRLEGRARTAVTEALSIDEMPALLLVDPNGKLVARDLPATRLRAAVAAVLPPPR